MVDTTSIEVCACPYEDESGYAIEVHANRCPSGIVNYSIISEGCEFEHLPHLIEALQRVYAEFKDEEEARDG